MNKVYNFKLSTLILFCAFLLGTSFSEANTNGTEPTPYIFKANASAQTLSWTKITNAAVMVVVNDNNKAIKPVNFSDYIANSEFRKGSSFDGATVAYKGNGNTFDLTGLNAGTDYFVNVYETNSAGELKDITNKVFITKNSDDTNNQKVTPSQTPVIAAPVVCPAVGGIVCTLNGTTGSGYIAGTAPCNTAGFAGTNPWDGGSCTGYISFSFSSPVKVATIKMIAVNLGGERTTVTATGGTGGALTVSGLSCMSAIGTVLGPYTGGGNYGDVAATITSAGTYTTITCTNTGCNSGWVASCPSFLSVLPIELISFTGECSLANVVDLKWKTISETNNDFFTIERSSNTHDWTIVGQLDGAGNTTQVREYSFTDRQRFNETMYYRIKQTDFNKEFEYSDIVAVQNCNLGANVLETASMYPSPANSEFKVRIDVSGVIMEIYNSLGIKIASYELQAGENKLDISSLENGTYYTKLSDNEKHSKMNKLMISR